MGQCCQCRVRRGFTLVELLVVIGIIALLVGILVPTLARARASSQRTACAANLKDIGNMMQMYLNDNQNRLMQVDPIPSDPTLVPPPALSIVQVLQPYHKIDLHKSKAELFHCPSDQLLHPDPTLPPSNAQSYFEREGTSYEYNAFFNAFAIDPMMGINRTWTNALAESKKRPPLYLSSSDLPLLVDFETFHGKAGKPESRNSLFADYHVGPLTLPIPKAP